MELLGILGILLAILLASKCQSDADDRYAKGCDYIKYGAELTRQWHEVREEIRELTRRQRQDKDDISTTWRLEYYRSRLREIEERRAEHESALSKL
jgi:hypothetical protein